MKDGAKHSLTMNGNQDPTELVCSPAGDSMIELVAPNPETVVEFLLPRKNRSSVHVLPLDADVL